MSFVMVVRSDHKLICYRHVPAQKRTGTKEFLIITFKYNNHDFHPEDLLVSNYTSTDKHNVTAREAQRALPVRTLQVTALFFGLK